MLQREEKMNWSENTKRVTFAPFNKIFIVKIWKVWNYRKWKVRHRFEWCLCRRTLNWNTLKTCSKLQFDVTRSSFETQTTLTVKPPQKVSLCNLNTDKTIILQGKFIEESKITLQYFIIQCMHVCTSTQCTRNIIKNSVQVCTFCIPLPHVSGNNNHHTRLSIDTGTIGMKGFSHYLKYYLSDQRGIFYHRCLYIWILTTSVMKNTNTITAQNYTCIHNRRRAANFLTTGSLLLNL